MYSPGLELTTPSSSGRRSNNFAMKDSRFGQSILLIYRQPIFKGRSQSFSFWIYFFQILDTALNLNIMKFHCDF